jgi:hypothetical protein
MYGLTIIRHRDDFDVVAEILVRHDEIERRATANVPMLPEAQKQWTATLGVNVGELSGRLGLRWTIASPDDIQPVCENLSANLVTYGSVMFASFNSIEDILRVLAEDDHNAQMYSPVAAGRAKRAIIAAYLIGDETSFRRIVADKSQYLSSISDFGLASFLELAKQLEAGLRSNGSGSLLNED